MLYPCGSDYSTIISNLPSTWSNECFGEKPEKPEIEYDLLATYNVTDISQPTTFITNNLSTVDKMYVDGIEVTPTSTYQFDTAGEHTVELVMKQSYKSIQNQFFLNVETLSTVAIGDSITSIGNEVFKNCKQLTSITIGDSVTSIGNNAFNSCETLSSITFGKSITTINNRAFHKCYSLTSFTFPEGVTKINDQLFEYCSGLTSIVIPDNITNIGASAFTYCTSLTSVTIGDSVTSIGYQAFTYCTSLTSIVIPDSVTSIGDSTFYNCSGLTSVTIGSGVINIGLNAFVSCYSLTSVTIGDSVTSIGNNAFGYCRGLTSIEIPNSVTSIGDSTFYNCSGLTSVTSYSYATFNRSIFGGSLGQNGIYKYPCGVDVSSIKSNSLLSTWSFECFEPDGIYEYDIATFVHTSSDQRNAKLYDTTKYTYFQNSIEKMYIDGVEVDPLTNETYTFEKAGVHSVKYVVKQNAGDNPYQVSDYAFYSCILLTSCILRDRITNIGVGAFNSSGLKTINMLGAVEEIGTSAFAQTDLEEFTFENGVIYGSAMLSGCTEMKRVTFNTLNVGSYACARCSSLTSVTINEGVQNIGQYAFSGCTGITEISIPSTVFEISNNTFNGCINLTEIKCFSKSIICIATAFNGISSSGTLTYYCDADINTMLSALPESYTKVCVKEFFGDYDVIATFNVTDISQPVKLFDSTTYLTSLAINDNEIGKVSTYNFSKTGEYTVKYKLTATKQPSFNGCNMMTSVELLEGCDTIKYGALRNCDNLSAVTLPSTITVISNFAFNSKNNMRIIRCYATTAPSVTSYSFSDIASNGMLYYPCGSDYSSWLQTSYNYLGKYNWSSDCFVPEGSSLYDISTIINVTSTTEPTQISADEITTQWFTSTPFRYYVDKMYVDGVEVEPATYYTFETTGPHVVGYTLSNKTEVPMASFSGMTNLNYVELADRIQYILPNAFEATPNLMHINIPDSVVEISNGAFYNSGIQYAFIGSGCTSMTWNAMQNCPNLEAIIFKSEQVPSYEADTFIDNPNLSTIGYICGNSPDSFAALATAIGVESVECISAEELQNFIDSL